MTRLTLSTLSFVTLALLACVPRLATAQDCPAAIVAKAKGQTMYLVYPTSSIAAYPEHGSFGVNTSPLAAFDIADLDSGIGTAAQLQARVKDLVEAAYCEFDVKVQMTTTYPTPTETRWQIVGIGSDTNGTGLSGEAEAVDTGDSDAQDHARFYVGEMGDWTGAELDGANSTRERWATAMTNLIAHESGHNYGGAHGDGVAKAGEDATANHYMTNPALGASPSSIVDSFNHFSDASYEILGHNLGLNIKTLYNWDFTNPNSSNADSLTITLLSKAGSLTIGWSYEGTLSPWTSPTVVKQAGTKSFQGDTYNEFELRFTTAKSWSGGSDGVAPPGVKFHVGATFIEADAVIAFETTLHAGASDLPLKPRIFGFDAGTSGGGGFAATFFNPTPDQGFLVLEDVEVLFLARMVDIEAMLDGVELVGRGGVAVQPFRRLDPLLDPHEAENQGTRRIGKEPLRIDLARLTDKRHLDVVYDPADCPNQPGSAPGPGGSQHDGDGPGFGDPNSPDYCQDGTALSLFPATYTLIRATVLEPNARHWDPAAGAMVDGPVRSRVFFQVAGVVPDFNRNGVDDLLDVRSGTSTDDNGNGVPDEAEQPQDDPDDHPWLLWWVLLIVVVLVVVILIARRRGTP